MEQWELYDGILSGPAQPILGVKSNEAKYGSTAPISAVPQIIVVSEETVWRTSSGVTVERDNSMFWTSLRLRAFSCLWSLQQTLDL